jgi:hypothetical protein
MKGAAGQYGCDSDQYNSALESATALCGVDKVSTAAGEICPPPTCEAAIARASAYAEAKDCGTTAYASALAIATNACGDVAVAFAEAQAVAPPCPLTCDQAFKEVLALAGDCSSTEFTDAESSAIVICGASTYSSLAEKNGGICTIGQPAPPPPVEIPQLSPVCESAGQAVASAYAEAGCESVAYSVAVAQAYDSCGNLANTATAIALAVGGACPVSCSESVQQMKNAASTFGCDSEEYKNSLNAATGLCGAEEFSKLSEGICPPPTCAAAVAQSKASAEASGCSSYAYASSLAIAYNACGDVAVAFSEAFASTPPCPVSCDDAVSAVQEAASNSGCSSEEYKNAEATAILICGSYTYVNYISKDLGGICDIFVPVPESVPGPTPEPEPQLQPVPEPVPEPDQAPGPELQPVPEPVPGPDQPPGPELQPIPEPAPGTDQAPGPELQPIPEPEPEPDQPPGLELQPIPEPEPEPPEPDATSDQQREAPAPDQPPVVEEPPVIEEEPPVIEEEPPVIEEEPPIIEEQPPVIEEEPPAPEQPLTCPEAIEKARRAATDFGCTSPEYLEAQRIAIELCGEEEYLRQQICPTEPVN